MVKQVNATASKAEQNRAIDGGLTEAIQFVDATTPQDSVVLVSATLTVQEDALHIIE